jgi:hypothetical protein
MMVSPYQANRARYLAQAGSSVAATSALGEFVPTAPVQDAHAAILAEASSFLDMVLPDTGLLFAVSWPHSVRAGKPTHAIVQAAPDLAKTLFDQDAAGKDVFFAVASFVQEWVQLGGKRKQRVRENVSAVRACWVDIDVGADKAASGIGYATQDEALAAFHAFSERLGLPPTFINSSGHGLHVYWAFTASVVLEQWQGVADALARACRVAGLRADHDITPDSARILRLPGTSNRKDPANPLPVRIMERGAAVDLQQFYAAVAGVAGIATQDAAVEAALPQRAGDVDNSDLGRIEPHPYLRGLSADAQLAMLDSACAAIPDGLWDTYGVWSAVMPALRGLHELNESARLSILEKHSARGAKWATDGWDRERLADKFATFKGGSVGPLFEAAQAHGWYAASAVGAQEVQDHETADAPATPAAVENEPTLERELTDEFLLVTTRGEGEYMDRGKRLLLKPNALNRALGHRTRAVGKSADQILRVSPLLKKVDYLGFHPGAGAIYSEDGLMYANMHWPVADEIKPSPAELQLIADFQRYLFSRPDDAPFKQFYQQFLAHIVQKPAVKIATALLFVGAFGVGKNTAAFDIPRLIVGPKNAQVINGKVLASQFSDQLSRAHLVYLDEVHCNGNWQSQDQANNLKSLVSDKRLVVHPKGHAAYDIPNRVVVTATSNYEDAMFLQANDRRWAVHEVAPARGYSPEQHRQYFNLLHAFLRSPRAAGALRWVYGRLSLSGFDAQNPPPITAAKQRMIEASTSPLDAAVQELKDAGEFPFDREVLVITHLRNALMGHVHGLEKVSDYRLAQALRSIGARPLDEPKRLKVSQLPGAHTFRALDARCRVWVLKNFPVWRDASESAISRHIATAAPALAAVPTAVQLSAAQEA